MKLRANPCRYLGETEGGVRANVLCHYWGKTRGLGRKEAELGDEISTGVVQAWPLMEIIYRLWPWQTPCTCYTWPPLTHWNVATVSPVEASCVVKFNGKHYFITLSSSKNNTYVIPIKPDFSNWLQKGRENEEKVKIIRAYYKKVIRNSSKRKWTNCFKVI